MTGNAKQDETNDKKHTNYRLKLSCFWSKALECV